ncbi:MAG TPA: transglycosylase family protein [Candidatus Dormibacteraeota bacterium]|nr:transglycosylase family protein [Candidatus Dormibacteraeota bacterium]HVA11453.1 transglycosylase family protein [Candidatus Dormibacteraeota bacterium]
MPIRPELRGSKVPHISIAAAAIVAWTINPIDSQTGESLRYASPVKHVGAPNHLHKASHNAKLDHKTHNPHHSQTHPAPAQIAASEVTPEEFAAWSKVNVCEEGGNWHVRGSTYSGGLGISNENWSIYGGEDFSHTAADATPREQIVVAMRIQRNPPDQHGCGRGW